MADENGSGAQGANGNTPSFDINTVVRGLLSGTNGDASKVVSRLVKENYRYRRDIDDLKAKLPEDGAVVLKGDDAKRWAKFSELGDPKEVTKRLSDAEAAVRERDDLKRGQTYREAAEHEAVRFNPSAFARLAKQDNLDVESREVTDAKGQKVSVPHAVTRGADGKESAVPLTEYATKHWAEFLPALGGNPTPAPRPGMPPRPNDTPPRPAPGETPQPADTYQSIRPSARYSQF